MANAREIQSRMKSIQDTMKITNAMYMISSTKLRKAKKSLEETEPYFNALRNMVSRVVRHLPDVENQYMDVRPNKAPEDRIKGFIVVTADKGLAGAYNHNVLKKAMEEIEQCKNYKLFVVGELGRQYFKKKNIPVSEQFHYTAQNPSLHRARIICEEVVEQFKEGELDEVYVIYTYMKSSITTEVDMINLLPITRDMAMQHEMERQGVFNEEVELQPSPNALLNNIVPDVIMGYIYGALMESFCSEQNARMSVIQVANDSASEMIRNLSIEYNRARQSMITQEITEVIAGAKAQKKKKKARKEVM